jgi:hypothetical protein
MYMFESDGSDTAVSEAQIPVTTINSPSVNPWQAMRLSLESGRFTSGSAKKGICATVDMGVPEYRQGTGILKA